MPLCSTLKSINHETWSINPYISISVDIGRSRLIQKQCCCYTTCPPGGAGELTDARLSRTSFSSTFKASTLHVCVYTCDIAAFDHRQSNNYYTNAKDEFEGIGPRGPLVAVLELSSIIRSSTDVSISEMSGKCLKYSWLGGKLHKHCFQWLKEFGDIF